MPNGNLSNMLPLPEAMKEALIILNQAWVEIKMPWLVGGSCGLLLQGVPLTTMPRDLDVYADRADVTQLHTRLQEYAVDEPNWSETGMYRSLLSHYLIGGVQIELVGSLQVDTDGSFYDVGVSDELYAHRIPIDMDGRTIPVMPLAHELIFNVMRNRSDRFEPIASVMRADWRRHDELIRKMKERIRISPHAAHILSRLVDWPGVSDHGFPEKEDTP